MLVTTILKASFKKARPKEVYYRDFKHFNNIDFKNELNSKLGNQIKDYNIFENVFLEVLDEHAPVKKKYLRANHAPYMTKTLRKAIMKRSELKSKYYKNKLVHNFQLHKKQRNYCSKLYKKENYFIIK